MATDQRTAEFLTEQIAAAGNVRYLKMFGEYALYCDDRVVALICDEQLYIKPTSAGQDYIQPNDFDEAPPYPGAKLYWRIAENRWDDPNWLSQLVRLTADALPAPKPKKPKRQK